MAAVNAAESELGEVHCRLCYTGSPPVGAKRDPGKGGGRLVRSSSDYAATAFVRFTSAYDLKGSAKGPGSDLLQALQMRSASTAYAQTKSNLKFARLPQSCYT